MPPCTLKFSGMNFGDINGKSPESFTVFASSLKRKRPPMIEIPSILGSVAGKSTSENCRSRSDAVFTSSEFGVGVCSVKGRKSFMEDAYVTVSSSNTEKGFFGVYDGHGGSKAAEFVAKNLHVNVFEMLEKCSGNTTIDEVVKAAFMKTDDEFLKQGLESGTCCVTVLIEGKEIVVSNLGDCRAVISKKGKAEALTKDHRASEEDERKRIQDQGGYVELHRGTWRVHGVLAVSRSIGDAHLKDWVVGEPETKVLPLTNDMEYLVLASDGLWDQVGNQEAIDIVTNLSPNPKKVLRPKLKKPRLNNNRKETENYLGSENVARNPGPDGLVDACKELVNLATSRGALDDITVMVVDLRAFR